MNLFAVFATGLFTGGLTCLAVQGGLLAATIAQRAEEKLKNDAEKSGHALPILSFLTTKLIAYTILGAFLGLLGSFFQLSITTQVILQIAVSIFMIGTALNILDVHPIFRYFIIQPPKFVRRMVRNQSKSGDLFAPAILGAFTIFIPCGTTQAMMALAIASGSPLLGAAIMFAFIVGTSPLFFILSYLAGKLSEVFQKTFMRFAAFAILLLAVFNINAALILSGSTMTLDRFVSKLSCSFIIICEGSKLYAAGNVKGSQTIPSAEHTIYISSSGYSPQSISVPTSSKVTLKLVNQGGAGCVQAFTIPKMNVQKIVREGRTELVQFQAPDNPQDIRFTCSMGMYSGIIHVI
ncbi:sulfite exporter TauE/SafE family protein [Candidatus Gottesmanbacteria bacterium]|nr:sulfite exporter TauE/SafE family protein [Candidatus Gottesmanbacteria bacterium]